MSSGDSVLVGIENNPEFNRYNKQKKQNINSSIFSEDGVNNPAFSRSIDEITAADNPFSTGTKTNPLTISKNLEGKII